MTININKVLSRQIYFKINNKFLIFSSFYRLTLGFGSNWTQIQNLKTKSTIIKNYQ